MESGGKVESTMSEQSDADRFSKTIPTSSFSSGHFAAKAVDFEANSSCCEESETEFDGQRIQKKPRLEENNDRPDQRNINPEKEALISCFRFSKADAYPATMTNDTHMDHTDLDVDGLMVYAYMELKMIIEWAKLIPGFRSLIVANQIAVLKSSFMELNVLRLSYRSMSCPGMLKFAQGVILPHDQCTKLGWSMELVESTLEFAKHLKELQLDSVEFAILGVVILASPDAAGIVDRDVVTNYQSQMLNLLEYYCMSRYPESPQRHGKILLRLPALRMISAMAADNFLSLSLHGKLQINELVAEMMDL